VGAQLVPVVLLGLILAIGLYWGITSWRTSLLEAEQARISAELGQEKIRVEALASTLAARATDEALATSIGALGAELEAKADLLGRLGSAGGPNDLGFSSHLTGLARRRVDGLWLQSIRLSAGGQSLELGGQTLAPARLPELLQLLGSEPSFAGRTFKSLRLERAAADSGAIAFWVSTDEAAP